MARQLILVDERSVKPDGWRDDWGEGNQGEYGSGYKIYKLSENQFIKVNYRTDSYDSNQEITSVEVVQGKEKTVVVYE